MTEHAIPNFKRRFALVMNDSKPKTFQTNMLSLFTLGVKRKIIFVLLLTEMSDAVVIVLTGRSLWSPYSEPVQEKTREGSLRCKCFYGRRKLRGT